MIRKGIGLFMAAVCLGMIGTAIGAEATAPNKENPCANLPNPPAVSDCWSCFQSLLADCDSQNPNGPRRNACYEGANNFFVWCLGRVGGGGAGANPRAPRNEVGIIERGEGAVYDIAFSQPVAPESVTVYVREIENGQVVMNEVKSYVFKNNDGSLSVFFDDTNLNLEDDKTIGVVTVSRNAQGEIEGAYAQAFDLVTPGDLDGDDRVDGSDIVVAWQKYGNGDMSYEDFMAYLSRYAR